MREIKFRGKRADGKGWISGQLYYSDNKAWITDSRNINLNTHRNITWFEVTPESVGQYTGLKDRGGKEIYEGDLCRVSHSGLCEIFWDDKRARFGVKWLDKTFKSIRGEVEMIFNNHEIVFEVIGNINDNPELLS